MLIFFFGASPKGNEENQFAPYRVEANKLIFILWCNIARKYKYSH